MKTTQFKNIFVISAFTVLLLNGCGQKFTASSELGSNSNNTGLDVPSNSGNTGSTDSSFQSLDMQGVVNDTSGDYNNKMVIDFDKNTGDFHIRLPLPFGFFAGAVQLSVPSLPGVGVEAVSDDTGNYLSLVVPAKYIVKGVQTLPSGTLPNGDKLPAIPSGELPRLAITLPQKSDMRIYLYIGVNAIGAYLEIDKFNDPKLSVIHRITLPVKNQAKTKVVGYLSLLGPTSSHPGGLFVSSVLPASISKIIDDHFNF